MCDEYLTFSNRDLYEPAWSKPMMELAKDFGMSDVALAKRLRKLGIPATGRGYWARVQRGKAPRRTAYRDPGTSTWVSQQCAFRGPFKCPRARLKRSMRVPKRFTCSSQRTRTGSPETNGHVAQPSG